MNPSTPGQRLRVALAYEGRSGAWLAEQLGISRMQVSRYCRDEAPIPKHRRREIARLLGSNPNVKE